MESGSYLTITTTSEGLYKEKGSRFISFACPVTTQEEIKSILEGLRKEHHSARHHCYAWMIGHERNNYRFNDDGEPSGSAGKPILGQINSYNLTNILIVVVRYFGGKLLGVSGLINAYRSAAESALKNAEIIVAFQIESLELLFPYASVNDVMKVLKDENIGHFNQKFDLECSVMVNLRLNEKETILSKLSRITGVRIITGVRNS